VKELATKLSNKYSEDPIGVYVLNLNSVCGRCVFGDSWAEGDAFLVRSKRSKYANLGWRSGVGDLEGLGDLIDGYLGGRMFGKGLVGETKGLFG
jgi:hypothetical protein